MTNVNDTIGNEAAFPLEDYSAGLSKREYFAALAMQGLRNSDLDNSQPYIGTARAAVKFADALIEALNEVTA